MTPVTFNIFKNKNFIQLKKKEKKDGWNENCIALIVTVCSAPTFPLLFWWSKWVQFQPITERVSGKVLCSNPLGMRVSSVAVWVHSGCLLPHRFIGDLKLYLGVNVSVNTFVYIIPAMNWWLFQGVYKVRGKRWTGEMKLFFFFFTWVSIFWLKVVIWMFIFLIIWPICR